ncbi:MAG: pentapeptide repeat-containing protein [Gemmatimonadota bacterium]
MAFNGGDSHQSHTMFRKDVLFHDTVFHGSVTFAGICCEGSGSFNRCRFGDYAKTVDFSGARFIKSVEFLDGMFQGGASFNSMDCGVSASFDSAQFTSSFHDIDFAGAQFGKMLNLRNATFRGGMYLYGLRCGLVGTLQGAKFQNAYRRVEFSNASFDYQLDCNHTEFAGPTHFDGCKFGYGTFWQAKFLDSKHLASFRFAQVGNNLHLHDALFAGGLDLEQTKVGGDLDLSRAKVHGHSDFHGTKVRRFRWGEDFPFDNSTVDLRQCTFEMFAGPETKGVRGRNANSKAREHARRFLKAQHTDFFSRDPYLQMERFYSRGGDDEEAREIYYIGRCHARQNAGDSAGNVQWSWARGSLDWLLKHLTGYGVKTYRVIPILLIFLAIGTVVFWKCEPEASAGDRAVQTRLLAVAPSKAYTASTVDDLRPAPKLFRRALFSLDLFIPVIEFPFTEKLKPEGFFTQAYALVHVVVGWLLIPLVIASITGVLRKEPVEPSEGAG